MNELPAMSRARLLDIQCRAQYYPDPELRKVLQDLLARVFLVVVWLLPAAAADSLQLQLLQQ